MYGVCKVCGCTDDDPCFHPDYGFCWWVDETHELCSHCADPDLRDSPVTTHRVNSSEGIMQDPFEVAKLEQCSHCEKREICDDYCDSFYFAVEYAFK